MNDSLGALLAIAVLWLILRFAFGGGSNSSSSGGPILTNVRARPVPQHMVEAVKSLFPHIPEASIRYDLQRSGSAQATCDRILSQGGLPAPPAGFFSEAAPQRPESAPTTTPVKNTKQTNLISRFGISVDATCQGAKTESTWSASPQERAKNLQERKRRMVLEARQKLLSKSHASP